jgi:hypothetical protein
MTCLRANDCTMAPRLEGKNRLMRVLRHLYCDYDARACARLQFAALDRDVPPDLMPNGLSTSLLREVGS